MRQIFTEINIDATAAEVWAVLTDLAQYSSWNPFVVRAAGRVAVGETLECHPRLPGSRRTLSFRPVVTKVVEDRLFVWQGHALLSSLAGGEHIFEIEKLDESSVRLVHRQNFWGLIVPVFWPLVAKRTEKGFNMFNEALKERVEKRAAAA